MLDWSLFVLKQKNHAYTLSWASFFVCLMVCLVPAGRANAVLTSSTVFSFDLTTSSGGVVESSGFLFGTLTNTSLSYGGAIYKVSVNGGTPETIYQLKSTDGYKPVAGLLVGSDGYLYGSTVYGARRTVFNLQEGVGTLFRVKQDGSAPEILHRFDADITNKSRKIGGLNLNFQENLEGIYPSFPLIEAKDSDYTYHYGVTSKGCKNGTGVVFRMCIDKAYPLCGENDRPFALEIIHHFGALNDDGTGYLYQAEYKEGAFPSGPLLLATDGKLYGVTKSGGKNLYNLTNNIDSTASVTTARGTGTVYRLNTDGTGFETIYSFSQLNDEVGTNSLTNDYTGSNSDGAFPVGSLAEISNANGELTIAGTTAAGGSQVVIKDDKDVVIRVYGGQGTVYKLTMQLSPSSAFKNFTTIHNFTDVTSYVSTGLYVTTGGVVLASDGRLYGAKSTGAIFSVDPNASAAPYDYKVEYSLGGLNSGLTLTQDKVTGGSTNLFGTTAAGGCGYGSVYRLSFDGSKATPYTNCTVYTSSSRGGGSMDKISLWALLGLAALVSVRRRVFGFY